MTLIIFLQWHLLVCNLKVNVLEAGKMGQHKDLSDLDE